MSENVNSRGLVAQQNDPSFANIWQELKWRGLVQVSTDEAELEKLLAGGPVTYYCGFDPTAPSLHLGNLVQLLTMRRLQLAGHRPLALVGGSTGLVGDPRPTAERTMNTKETVSEWVGYLQGQVQRFLSFEGDNAARMVNNLDWTAPMSAIDFLRDIGKHFRVGTMIKKEIVSSRLNSDEGISYAEFSYQVLQGMDYLELFRNYNCVLETGGSDQWGNLTSGTELVRKVEGKTVHALGTPLVTNSDGTKFGKSEGNAVWLDGEMTSPYAMYQFWLNTSDKDVVDRLKVFTFMSRSRIEELERSVAEAPHKREAQRALAFDVTSLIHGAEATEKVIAASAALFGQGEVKDLDEATLKAATAELPAVTVSADGLGIIDLLVASGLSGSKSEARRTVSEGGAYVNNVKVADADTVVDPAELLHGKYLLLRRGKRNLATVEVTAV
ncbi:MULTISPECIES: tyrosine--tRNA ligase [unclassified Arthrobacter]|uniref:tyrosine--tRNA ligase n=1 Tax=unclassified Arthrobacter TaxID=235627 RepID=UPI0024C22E8C|nr:MULTISPECIES: tyrosine--tRNA ligase [unclassified Arthrobacter]MDK1317320.1 tyrosine--tRNA ligase [Arthrobacter sp. zg.Y20]MDK1328814.1 tyrosine--tRNA ligase [Arthrobacter sp. zg-Y1143]WIB07402.1 tyrosine--tRNA ligase [Arthrobacter sp. zg-Y20]